MNKTRLRVIWTLSSCVLALLFGIYVLLDTFLLARVEQTAAADNLAAFEALASRPQSETETETRDETQAETQALPADAENAVYADENVCVALTQYREYDTDIYVAEVWLSSAQYLKTALAQNSYGKNVTAKTSEMAAQNNAILAVNGDYYGARESGCVIRNGVVYRDCEGSDADVLCIYADGSFAITDSGAATASELAEQGVWQAFSFGPGLLEDGEITVNRKTEVGRSMASNPRTAIGQIGDLHYVFVVSDGRTEQSEGLSLYELATFLQRLGVRTAYNLDGGGSSTMVVLGRVVNNPTTNDSDHNERSVSDIVYITAG